MSNQLEDDLKRTFHWSSTQAERFMIPAAVSCPGFPNIKIQFNTFRRWLDDSSTPPRQFEVGCNQLHPHRDQYMDKVTKLITNMIFHTRTGAAVLREIRARKLLTVTISPFNPLVDDLTTPPPHLRILLEPHGLEEGGRTMTQTNYA